MHIIKIISLADGTPINEAGQYLKSFDPETNAPLYPTGSMDTTADRTKAKQYESYAAAFEEWRRTSVQRPLRPDGRPNRPLTAFTVEIEPL